MNYESYIDLDSSPSVLGASLYSTASLGIYMWRSSLSPLILDVRCPALNCARRLPRLVCRFALIISALSLIFGVDVSPRSDRAVETGLITEARAHNFRKQQLVLLVTYEVTASELRMTLCVPGPLLNGLLKAPLDFNYSLSRDIQANVLDQLSALLNVYNPVLVDGVKVQPRITSLDIVLTAVSAELKRAQSQDQTQSEPSAQGQGPSSPDHAQVKVQFHSGLKGAVLIGAVYPLKAVPKDLRLRWTHPSLFDKMGRPRVGQLSTKIMPGMIVYGDHIQPLNFTPQDPEAIWRPPFKEVKQAPLSAIQVTPPPPPRLPILSLLCFISACALYLRRRSRWKLSVILLTLSIGVWWIRPIPIAQPWSTPTSLTDEEARPLFEALHQNIYRAFDYEGDEQIYDALAQSVSGGLLDWTFQTIYKSLILREEGGARAQVSIVRPLKWERAPLNTRDLEALHDAQKYRAGAFSVRYVWRVVGEVTHWGHSHRRVNEYRAQYWVAHTAEGWRIIKSKPLGQARRPELEGRPTEAL
jgi:hypothetical protein